VLHELVGGHHAAGEILWDENDADQHAGDEVSEDNLQKAKIGVIGQGRCADDGQRAGLSGYDGERNGRPGNVLVREKIIAQRALLFAKAQAKESNTGQINGDDGQIKGPEFKEVQRRSPVLLRIALGNSTQHSALSIQPLNNVDGHLAQFNTDLLVWFCEVWQTECDFSRLWQSFSALMRVEVRPAAS